jgi:hypothetical protein
VSVAPATTDPAKAAGYQPLSLLAIVGAGLAALYALVIVVGGFVAFLRGAPWFLPGWTLIVPGISPIYPAVLSVLALLQVRRSESTLAGDKLARWGLMLSIIVGLSYWAYVGTTYFAVGTEARDRAAKPFLDKLTSGQTLSAFLLTLPPGERPAEGPDLRAQVEARFNGVEPTRGGQYTTFSQLEFVRMLTWAGAGAKIEPIGVEECKYTGGGYQVRLLYRIDSPTMSFAMGVVAQGDETKGPEGRQWYIMWDRCTLQNEPKPHWSDLGQKQLKNGMTSREYLAKNWISALQAGRTYEPYLATLLPAEQQREKEMVAKTLLGLVTAEGPEGGAVPLSELTLAALACDPELAWAMASPGYRNFLAGGLVRADKDTFYAPEGVRDEIIALIKNGFRNPNHAFGTGLAPDTKIRFPWIRTENGRLVAENDFMIRLPIGQPKYAVEGRVVVDCDEGEVEAGEGVIWRVRSVDLVSAKPAFVHLTPEMGGRGMPGSMGGRPMTPPPPGR